MKKIFAALLLICIFAGHAKAQTPYTAPWGFNYSAPTAAPSALGTHERLDITTGRIYQWSPDALNWQLQGYTIEQISGSVAPAYAPVRGQSWFVVNSDTLPRLYQYTGMGTAWKCLNCSDGKTYTAGMGIAISGTNIISNTGDLSNTNELNTGFDIFGGNLRVIDAGATRTVALTSIAPVQSVTGGTGIIVSGTNALTVTNTGDLSNTNEIQQIDTFRVNGTNVELSLSSDGVPAKTIAVSSIAPVQAVTGGTGITVSGANSLTVTNSAPDLTVSITGAGSVAVTGTYPSFALTGTGITALTGDVTATGPGSVAATIANSAVTSAKLAINSVDSTHVKPLSIANSDIANVAPEKMLQNGATVGQVLKWSGGQWLPGTDAGGITALTGDVTAGGTGSVASTIANGAVTGAKLANGAVDDSLKMVANVVSPTRIPSGGIHSRHINQMGATSGDALKWNGTKWAPSADLTGWVLTGNSATAGSSFLGTTNNVSLRIRTNNVQRLIVDSIGWFGFGVNVPLSPYHFAGTYSPTGINMPAFKVGLTYNLPSSATSTQLYSVLFSGAMTQTNANQLPTGVLMNYTVNSGGFAYNQNIRGTALSIISDASCLYGIQGKFSGENNTDPAFSFVQNGSLNTGDALKFTKQNSAGGDFIHLVQGNDVGTKRFIYIQNDAATSDGSMSQIATRFKSSALPYWATTMHSYSGNIYGHVWADGFNNFPMITWGGKTYFNSSGMPITDPIAVIRARGTGSTSSTYTLLLTNNNNNTATASVVVRDDGLIGFGTNAPTARVTIAAGSASANTAPIKLTSGTLNTTPENGAVEFDGTDFYGSASSARQIFLRGFKGSGALDFPSTGPNSYSTLTITDANAVAGDIVNVNNPFNPTSGNYTIDAGCAVDGTVWISYHNHSTGSTFDPSSATFKYRILK